MRAWDFPRTRTDRRRSVAVPCRASPMRRNSSRRRDDGWQTSSRPPTRAASIPCRWRLPRPPEVPYFSLRLALIPRHRPGCRYRRGTVPIASGGRAVRQHVARPGGMDPRRLLAWLDFHVGHAGRDAHRRRRQGHEPKSSLESRREHERGPPGPSGRRSSSHQEPSADAAASRACTAGPPPPTPGGPSPSR